MPSVEESLKGEGYPVYKGALTAKEGITTGIYQSRDKYFIVLGEDDGMYGCIIINSDKRLANYQYSLSGAKYPAIFTKEESFADCSQIKEFPKVVLERSRHVGYLSEGDSVGIMLEIGEARTIAPEIKKKYGL